jgi:hypothetical protein
MKPALAATLMLLLSTFGLATDDQAPPVVESSCITCHGDLDDPAVEYWSEDVHALAALGCEGCHGGDPSPELADDIDAAMAPSAGFIGSPDRLEISTFCGTCHADAKFINAYNPKLRTDQLSEYLTSVHGERNAEGDPVPATCTDCHGVHGIQPVSIPSSPVYVTNVPETCGKCHADKKIMEPYGTPTDQLETYTRSVHGTALFLHGDTGAPACNDCHGNHGATPPGVTSVANVCGQCHAFEADFFRASFKKELFDDMEEPECSSCHNKHDIRHPTPEWMRTGSGPQLNVGRVTGNDPFRGEIDSLPDDGSIQAIWNVALLPGIDPQDPTLVHTVDIEIDGQSTLQIDAAVLPGNEAQIRTGSTEGLDATLTIESLSGSPVKAGDAVRFTLDLRLAEGHSGQTMAIRDRPGEALRPLMGSICMTCHTEGDECDQATTRMYEAISSAESTLRRAEAALDNAERAGMPIESARVTLHNDGNTATIQARALLHTFDPARVTERAAEAQEAALVALGSADDAMQELHTRHVGLGISLIFVVLVLVLLGLKIRQVDQTSTH